MAGQLTVDTLRASTGVLATQNGMTGIAKAWVNFNGTGTVAIRDSFNVSSITDNGTGDYTVNFTTPMTNANYCITASAQLSTANNNIVITPAWTSAPTTTAMRFSTTAGSNGASYDCAYVYTAVHGS
jgi:hypothetical protein